MKIRLKKILNHMRRAFNSNPWSSKIILTAIAIAAFAVLGLLLVKTQTRAVETPKDHAFSGGRKIVGTSQVFKKKNRAMEKKIEDLVLNQKLLQDSLSKITKSIETLELVPRSKPQNNSAGPTDHSYNNTQPPPATTQIKADAQQSGATSPQTATQSPQRRLPLSRGPSVISFPTESKPAGAHRIHLSPGSYVETVLLSGVQATSGKPFPVLMKATQSFIGPNKTRVDLSGCFILGKAMGNLSLGRVEIQPFKLACTARSGRLFERDLKGFVADKNDNSFGVTGEVDLKADSRLATLSFLSSMIEGIGKNIEKLQTKTTQTENGSSSVVSGNEGRYIVAGGAASAANKMTDFFLRHAENLLPTINIHSSQKLYVVIQDSVDLPSWYFKPNKKRTQSDFAYLSRLID